MPISLPDSQHRLRCGRCGNLTRFDVARVVNVKEFWHLDMAGNAAVESSEQVSEQLLNINCRWCGATEEIEHVLRPDAGGPAEEPDSAR